MISKKKQVRLRKQHNKVLRTVIGYADPSGTYYNPGSQVRIGNDKKGVICEIVDPSTLPPIEPNRAVIINQDPFLVNRLVHGAIGPRGEANEVDGVYTPFPSLATDKKDETK